MRVHRLIARLAWSAALAISVAAAAAEPVKPEIVEVRRIWDDAPHNAFTDLIRFKDAWYCTFREGKAHVSPDGAIRVITSPDGETWTSAARITRDGVDLRDPKLVLAPGGRLMLNAVAATPKAEVRHRSMVWFSADGKEWGDGKEVGEPNVWIWRPAWHGDAVWAVGYSTHPDRPARFARLYSSADGVAWKPVVENLIDEDSPSESALLFLADGACYCLLRRDAGTATGQLGVSKPPYREWAWKDLGVRIGGPALARLPDGRIVAAVRLYEKKVRTALCWFDPDGGKLTEFLTLPSGGDTSYAGLVFREGLVWVSYYSSHEGKTSIYLAKVRP